MGANTSVPVGDITSFTRLSEAEVKRLCKRFRAAVGKTGRDEISYESFAAMPELAGCSHTRRLFAVIDTNGRGSLNFMELALALSTWRSLKTLEDRSKFLLKLYDLDSDGRIGQSDLEALMQPIAGAHVPTRHLQQLVEHTLEAYDKDGDGFLNEREFGMAIS